MSPSRMMVLLIAVLAVGPLVAAPARAQDTLEQDAAERRIDRARTLFTDGVAHVAAQRLPEAEVAFREALSLRDAPTIRYNLASVLFEQGEYPEATAHIDALLADTSVPADIREHTADLRRQIAERAGYARIELRGGAGAQVSIDGYLLPELDVELPLAPGAHIATAVQTGREIARAEAEIQTGEHRTITLDTGEPDVEAQPIATAQTGEPQLVEQWWFWTAIGGGVVVVAIVIGASVAASSSVESPIEGNFQPGVVRW